MGRKANPFLKSGLPFLGLMLGGFAGLTIFLQGKFDVQVRLTVSNYRRCHTKLLAFQCDRSRACNGLQDANKKEVDLRAPVQKQRAKKFDINEELEVGTVLHCCMLKIRP